MKIFPLTERLRWKFLDSRIVCEECDHFFMCAGDFVMHLRQLHNQPELIRWFARNSHLINSNLKMLESAAECLDHLENDWKGKK